MSDHKVFKFNSKSRFNNMNFDNDLELIKALRAGGRQEHEALEYLSKSREYRTAVRKYILNNRGQLADVDLIYNEGLFALYKKVKLLNAEKIPYFTIGGYLFTSCRYLWLRELAKRKARKGFLDQLASLFMRKPRSMTDSLSQFDKKKLELVEQIIDEMGEPCRSIMLMNELGYSFAEIVGTLSISSEVNARVINHRCIKKLKQKLKEQLSDDI